MIEFRTCVGTEMESKREVFKSFRWTERSNVFQFFPLYFKKSFVSFARSATELNVRIPECVKCNMVTHKVEIRTIGVF